MHFIFRDRDSVTELLLKIYFAEIKKHFIFLDIQKGQ